ncbi:hypothetical protein [Neisseria iguanae]|nr:hypothetical protein [Neisseria iguanae]
MYLLSMPSEIQTAGKQAKPLPGGRDTCRPSENPIHTRDTESLKYWPAIVLTFTRREAKELIREKIRLVFAVFGPLIMLVAMA